ncbi:hypothetical protein KAFR_0D04380 [Kazachstania africana CBS 2517]|uniref:UBX domain-containing protein n=1 Tax=Kazachstania africana (strain ATCC 22294 / BCRC 22015 / CBS 2517 / CECT 1963 / NBRC 1671 / NRRL Y-8276) TaxID=1071382 RepID=H2AUN6_KAZAF|nr:hypothetical protein KAFR_0D04380 [Kazachstania africana CBS 2517]CCF58086.1 hypothetical protein KAFR_0D04380 [Kazachstania africana CBS 2517]
MSQEQIDNFMAITSTEDSNVARQFIEMADGNLDIAISLFFEHGSSLQTSDSHIHNSTADSEMAERLQNEAYQESQEEYVRPPDEARHETLTDTHVFHGTYGGIGGSFNPLTRNADDMFDHSRPRGVFNQHLEGDYSDFSNSGDSESDYEYAEETVVELDEDGNVQEVNRMVRRPRTLTKEEKLAKLFRPPFDVMSRISLDEARAKARDSKKWIMINIQDTGIFQCQQLNRDLWASRDVKHLIRKSFVFLQYQFESTNAKPYLNFYGVKDKNDLPHIAILDSITGERLKQWNRSVPTPIEFITEVNKFLEEFSLDPNSVNPTIKEPTPELDPTELTEEQQMEFAIRESLGVSPDKSAVLEEHHTNEEDEQVELDPFDSIVPATHSEPPNKPGITTRIQIRTGDGKRIVRRFNASEDTVRTIYQFIKHELEEFKDCKFLLSDHGRENLIDKLDMTIEDAGLKNSSVLLEKEND